MSCSILRRKIRATMNMLTAIFITGCIVVAIPGVSLANPEHRSPYALSREKTQALMKLIEHERSEAGLPALALDEDLVQVAEQHAVDMIDSGYFGHSSPTTGTLASRLKAADVRFSKAAENLAGCTTVELAHKLLMASTSHSANILSPRFSQVGVAVVDGGLYGMMIVEVFVCEPEVTSPADTAPLVDTTH